MQILAAHSCFQSPSGSSWRSTTVAHGQAQIGKISQLFKLAFRKGLRRWFWTSTPFMAPPCVKNGPRKLAHGDSLEDVLSVFDRKLKLLLG